MNTFLINEYNEKTDWSLYLENLDTYMKSIGYSKYKQNFKSEDFAYWKSYNNKYQIGLLVYDWRKFPRYDLEKKVSISFECMNFQ